MRNKLVDGKREKQQHARLEREQFVSTYSNKPYIHPLLWAHPQFQTYHLVPSKKTILCTKKSLNKIHWNMFPLQYANRYCCWWSTPQTISIDTLAFITYPTYPQNTATGPKRKPTVQRSLGFLTTPATAKHAKSGGLAGMAVVSRFMEIQAAKAVRLGPLNFKWFKVVTSCSN